MKSIKMRVVLFYLLLLTLIAAISCGDSKVRKYKEKAPPAAKTQQSQQESTAPADNTMPAHNHTHFQWAAPEGWKESRTSSGFRLASFTVKSGDIEAICTIIPLQGEAGGLKANVTRWLDQITGKMTPNEETVESLLKSQEKFLSKGQFPVVLIDLTPVTPKPIDKSILAAVLKVQGNSIFIKMTGQKSLLIENKAKFKALCQSFSF